MIRAIVIAVFSWAFAGPIFAEPITLREALQSAGFKAAIASLPAGELDRTLTSSSYGADGHSFVAAVYFEDQLNGNYLGPLHLFWVTKDGRVRRRQIEAEGSILSVSVGESVAVLRAHRNPSAGGILVIDRDLAVTATLDGFNPQLDEAGVWFTGNMTHFAPTHQSRLFFYDVRSRATTEVFPGPTESSYAVKVRAAVIETAKRLPADAQAVVRKSVDGPIDDFDRSILVKRSDRTGQRIALVVSYRSSRLSPDADDVLHFEDVAVKREPSWPSIELETVALCERSSARAWSCRERLLSEAMRQFNVKPPGDEWEDRHRAFQTVLQRELAQK